MTVNRQWLRAHTLAYLRQTEKGATEQEIDELADEFVERLMEEVEDADKRSTSG